VAGIDLKIYLTAAAITLLLFALIYVVNYYFNERRERIVEAKMNEIIDDFEEIETTYYLMEYLGGGGRTCDVIVEEISYLESKLWKLDGRIRGYREVTKDFASDEFYIQEKKRLNRREIIHMSMLDKVRKRCGMNQTIILYFYGQCKRDRKCDEQGFVLTYINQKIDPEIAIFSFDTDLSLSSVNALTKLYNVTEYPCTVIEGRTHCGLHDKDELETLLCEYSPGLTIC